MMQRITTSIIAACLTAALLASCGQQRGRPRGPLPSSQLLAGVPGGSPSDIVAAELRFARLAQEEGQWTAFRKTAAKDAYSFTPNLQRVDEWLKNKDDPPRATTWEPYHVVISCDGSMAAARGAWQAPNGASGYYTTVWQKQRDGEYRWLFDHASSDTQPEGDPGTVTSDRADCERPRRRGPGNGQQGAAPTSGSITPAPGANTAAPILAANAQRLGQSPIPPRQRTQRTQQQTVTNQALRIIEQDGLRKIGSTSRDNSLTWEAVQRPDGSRTLTVKIRKDGAFVTAIDDQRAAPAGDGGAE